MKIRIGKYQRIVLALVAINFYPASELHAQDNRLSLSLTTSSRFGAKSSQMAKVGRDLKDLYSEFEKFTQVAGIFAAPQFRARKKHLDVSGGYVTVDAIAAADPAALRAELEALNFRDAAMRGSYISGRLPISAIAALAKSKNLKFVRPAYFVTHAGLVDSQGDMAMRADVARPLYGVDGTGITVGTMSDSFDCLGGAAADVAGGDLPPGIIVLDDTFCTATIDEGRAMMQLIADVAPGANQIFHTAARGQANFAQGIIDLANAGADVIVDDLIYLAEPMFQDGIVAQEVDTVAGMGVAYFSSAGNSGRQSYEAPFDPSGQIVNIGGWPVGEAHDFDPGPAVDIYQRITIPNGATLSISIQWDSAYFSVSGAPGSANDIDIYLIDSTGAIVEKSDDYNSGGDPVEILEYENSDPSPNFDLLITIFEGPDPGLLKYVSFNSKISINEFGTDSGTSYGHSNASGAESVGAAYYADTPQFGIDPAVVEDFSSAGGIPILFDVAGNRLSAPEVRDKPEIVAPDGTNTTFFGIDDGDSDSFPNFFGTSAAAPHAAAVAALLLEADPSLLPHEVYAALEGTALDMDDPSTPGFDSGFDYVTGYGFIQADAALDVIAPPCPGDLDNDRDVDENDLRIFSEAFGQAVCSGDCAPDFDQDGDVDGDDLRRMGIQLEEGCVQ